jgi:site-specific recombinase XerD
MKLLLWLYKSKTSSKGLAPLFMRITVNGKKSEIATGIHLQAKQWNTRTGCVRGTGAETKEMNKRLELLKATALNAYHSFAEKNATVSAGMIKQKMSGQENDGKTLLKLMRWHNETLNRKSRDEVAKATVYKYEILAEKVSTFINRKLKQNDINLKDLNHAFVTDFEMFLKTEHGISHNTAIKYIQFLKKVIHLAIANGWITEDPFRNFRCSLMLKDRGYLTVDELRCIEAKPIRSNRLHTIRQVFVFSCYTGLSYADIKGLFCRHIETKGDGSRWIVINRAKTGVRSAIPLLPKARQILDSYEPPFFPDNDRPLMPIISNQKMNAYLKELAELCIIDKHLTFHLARHTFATTVTLTNGVPIETVSKMLGHANLKTTQLYSKVVDTKIANDMNALMIRLQ